MIAGNVGMLAQHDLKRLLAIRASRRSDTFSSRSPEERRLGLRYAIYYLTAYAFMNLGRVCGRRVDLGRRRRRLAVEQLSRPGAAAAVARAAMTIFLLALAGCRRPPVSSERFDSAVTVANGYIWLAAALIVGTAISLYAYAKVDPRDVRTREEAPAPDRIRSSRWPG